MAVKVRLLTLIEIRLELKSPCATDFQEEGIPVACLVLFEESSLHVILLQVRPCNCMEQQFSDCFIPRHT